MRRQESAVSDPMTSRRALMIKEFDFRVFYAYRGNVFEKGRLFK